MFRVSWLPLIRTAAREEPLHLDGEDVVTQGQRTSEKFRARGFGVAAHYCIMVRVGRSPIRLPLSGKFLAPALLWSVIGGCGGFLHGQTVPASGLIGWWQGDGNANDSSS